METEHLSTTLGIKFLAYQIAFPNEADEVFECAKTLDKILAWNGAMDE